MRVLLLFLQLIAPKEVVDLQNFVIQRSVLFQHPMTENEAFEVAITAMGIHIALGVPWYLTLAVLEKESRYDIKALSKANCQGLVQLNPKTARSVALRLGWVKYDLHQPWENLVIGMYYLFLLTEQYGLKNGLTVYNMGHRGWEKIGKRQSRYSKGAIRRGKLLQKKLKEQNDYSQRFRVITDP